MILDESVVCASVYVVRGEGDDVKRDAIILIQLMTKYVLHEFSILNIMRILMYVRMHSERPSEMYNIGKCALFSFLTLI